MISNSLSFTPLPSLSYPIPPMKQVGTNVRVPTSTEGLAAGSISTAFQRPAPLLVLLSPIPAMLTFPGVPPRKVLPVLRISQATFLCT